MKQTLRLEQNSSFYSDTYCRLIEQLALHPNRAKDIIKNRGVELPDQAMVDFFQLNISSWPVIISKDLVGKFDHFVQKVSRILFQAITLYFGDDDERFARESGVASYVLEMLNREGLDSKNLLARHDVLICNGIVKLLEVNAGSVLGGWELSMLAERMLDSVNALMPIDKSQYQTDDQMVLLFEIAVEAIKNLSTTSKTGNIIFTFVELSHDVKLSEMEAKLQAFMSKHQVTKAAG